MNSSHIIIMGKENFLDKDNLDLPLEYSLEGPRLLERRKCIANHSTLCGIHCLEGWWYGEKWVNRVKMVQSRKGSYWRRFSLMKISSIWCLINFGNDVDRRCLLGEDVFLQKWFLVQREGYHLDSLMMMTMPLLASLDDNVEWCGFSKMIKM